MNSGTFDIFITTKKTRIYRHSSFSGKELNQSILMKMNKFFNSDDKQKTIFLIICLQLMTIIINYISCQLLRTQKSIRFWNEMKSNERKKVKINVSISQVCLYDDTWKKNGLISYRWHKLRLIRQVSLCEINHHHRNDIYSKSVVK